jgi:hypothetical protein
VADITDFLWNMRFVRYRDMGKKVQGYGEKGTGIWGRVQGYGADGLRTKVKFFYLTYFTFGFTLPVSTLIL